MMRQPTFRKIPSAAAAGNANPAPRPSAKTGTAGNAKTGSAPTGLNASAAATAQLPHSTSSARNVGTEGRKLMRPMTAATAASQATTAVADRPKTATTVATVTSTTTTLAPVTPLGLPRSKAARAPGLKPSVSSSRTRPSRVASDPAARPSRAATSQVRQNHRSASHADPSTARAAPANGGQSRGNRVPPATSVSKGSLSMPPVAVAYGPATAENGVETKQAAHGILAAAAESTAVSIPPLAASKVQQVRVGDASHASDLDNDDDDDGDDFEEYDGYDYIDDEHGDDSDDDMFAGFHAKSDAPLDQPDTRDERLERLKKAVKYRAYQSYRPCANKLLQMKIDKEAMDRHDKKLSQAMPRINTAPPRKYIISRAKQLKDRQEKVSQIEACNKVLLKRIIYQQKARKPLGLFKKSALKKTPVEGRGLNGPHKREVEHQIMEENRALLARLESQQAHYARMKWDEERRKNLFYLANIASHPMPFIEEIEELGLHKHNHALKKVGDPYRPATAPAEVERLLALKQSMLDQADEEAQGIHPPARWQPAGPLLPRVAMLPPHPMSAGTQGSRSPIKTGPDGKPVRKKLGPLIPRVALLGMARAKKAVPEIKEPQSIAKTWTRTKVFQVERKLLFARFEPISRKSQRRDSRRLSVRINEASTESLSQSMSAITPTSADPETALDQHNQVQSPTTDDEMVPRITGGGAHMFQSAESIHVTENTIRNSFLSQSHDQSHEDLHLALASDHHLRIEHTMEAVITGVPGLSVSYPVPELTSRTVWLFFSSTTEDTVTERDVFMEKCVPDLRNLCRSRGFEFRCVEILGGAVHEALINTHQIPKVYMRELERCINESSAVNFLAVLGDKYGARVLQPEIPSSTFNLLLKEIKAMGDDCMAGVSTLTKWYKLDENMVPPHRILQPITSEFPDFVNDGDPEKKAHARRDWESKVLIPLQADLKIAALALGEQDKLKNEIAQKFAQSMTHEEVMRGIYNQRVDPSTNRVLGKTVVVFRNTKVPKSSQVASVHESDPERTFMDTLKSVVRSWVPKQNLIVENVPPVDENSPTDTARNPVHIQRIMQKLVDAISASVIYHADMSQTVDTPNALIDEILHHIRFVKSRSKEFVRREHVVERITNYMVQTKMKHVLPLVITGAPGTGKSGVIAKSLQKVASDIYAAEKRARDAAKRTAQETEDTHAAAEKPVERPPARRPSTAISSLGSGTPAFARRRSSMHPSGQGGMADSDNNRPAFAMTQMSPFTAPLPPMPAHTANGAQPQTEPRHVIVFRCIAITHASASTSNLMLSLAAQISQAYGISQISTQYEDPLVKFRRALRLPTRERPLLLVLTKLDQLQFDNESERSMGWLLDDLPAYINLVLAVHDERFARSLLPNIMAKIVHLVPHAQADLREKKGTIDTTKWTLPVSLDQCLLPIGDFIPTVAKVALKRYLGLDARRLRPEQEEMVMHAFERANLLDLQRMGTASPLLLRLLYNITRPWRSYETVSLNMPISVSKTLELVFATLEKEYIAGVVATVCSILTLSRDGLASTEIEDMLSLKDDILQRTILWTTARVTRISPVFFLRLLNALTDTGLLMVRLGPNGTPLFRWTEPEFAECARSRYLSTSEEQTMYAGLLCDYFSGKYHIKKTFSGGIGGDNTAASHASGPTGSSSSSHGESSIAGNGRPSSVEKDGVVLAEHRGVPEQPTKLTEAALIFGRWAERRAAWNIRKIRELPKALSKAHRWQELLDAMYDIEVIEGMRETSGVYPTIREMREVLRYGAKEGMSLQIQDSIHEVLEFLRERAEQIIRTPSYLLPGYMYDQLLRIPEDHPLAKLGKPMRLLHPDNAWQYYGRVQCVRAFLPVIKYGQREPPARPETPDTIMEDPSLRKLEYSPLTFYNPSAKESLPVTSIPVVIDVFDASCPAVSTAWTPFKMRPSYASSALSITHMIVARDNSLVVVATAEGNVLVRSLETLEEMYALPHGSPVTAMCASPDGALLMTACGQSGDYRLTVWSLSDGTMSKRIRARSIGVSGIVVGCGFVASPSDDVSTSHHRAYAVDNVGTLKIFGVEVTRVFAAYNCERGDVVSRMSPDGKHLAIGGRNVCYYNTFVGVDAWDQRAFAVENTRFKYHATRQIRFNVDGSVLYTLSTIDAAVAANAKALDLDSRSVVQAWNTVQGQSVVLLQLEDQTSTLAVSPDGRFLCTAGSTLGLRVWNSLTGDCLAERHVSDGFISCEIVPETLSTASEPGAASKTATAASGRQGRGLSGSGSPKKPRSRKPTRSKMDAAAATTPSQSPQPQQQPHPPLQPKMVLPSHLFSGLSMSGSRGATRLVRSAGDGAPDGADDDRPDAPLVANSSMFILAATKDGFLRQWKVPPRRETPLPLPKINSVGQSSDGDYFLANATQTNAKGDTATTSLTIYDAHSGRRVACVPAVEPAIWTYVAAPGTLGINMIVYSGTSEGTVRMYAWPPALSHESGPETQRPPSPFLAARSVSRAGSFARRGSATTLFPAATSSALNDSSSASLPDTPALPASPASLTPESIPHEPPQPPKPKRKPGRWQTETLVREFRVIPYGRPHITAIAYALQPQLGMLAVATRDSTPNTADTTRDTLTVTVFSIHTGEAIHESRIRIDSLQSSPFAFVPLRPFSVSWSRTDAFIFARLPPPELHDVPNPALLVFGGEKVFLTNGLTPSRSSAFASLVLQKAGGKAVTAVAQCLHNPVYAVYAFGDQVCVIREQPDDPASLACIRQITCSFKDPVTQLAMIDDGVWQLVVAMTSAGTIAIYDLNHSDKSGTNSEEVACWIAGVPLTSMVVSEGPSQRDLCWRIALAGPGGFATVLRLRL
ncbi:hypothetical protein BC831DRAFT_6231 [Entophlyctis helioformis]|nr:hypothetical protein BC831DRAFT_6231 [Entophlyctis helioformis]